LAWLADNHVCHRDIKPENIMLNSERIPKIVDLALVVHPSVVEPKKLLQLKTKDVILNLFSVSNFWIY